MSVNHSDDTDSIGITGSIPESIGNLSNLTYLELSNNRLTGSIPESICNLSFPYNWSLDLSSNEFCPLYPQCLSEENIGYQDTSECAECSFVGGDLNNDLALNVYDIIRRNFLIISEKALVGINERFKNE